MSESERSPLLGPQGKATTSNETDSLSESTPLLASSSATPRYDGEHDDPDGASVTSGVSHHSGALSPQTKKKRSVPWPSIIAIIILAILAVGIMLGAFFVPAAVEEYAKQAAVLEPTNLALESITANGVRARIQANFRLDGSRVQDASSRRIGRFATWVVRKLGTEETKVGVYLPEYGNILLGTAALPPLTINIVDGQTTAVDFIAELAPGDAEGYRTIANDWLDGKLDRLKVLGKANINLKSGILPLGTHAIAETLVFEAKQIPTLPKYNISRLNFRDLPTPDGKKAVGADVSISAFNQYPVSLDIPELGFEILVPNCDPNDQYILVADAITQPVDIKPRSDVTVDAQGIIRELPESLTQACPHSDSSPLDKFLKQYLNGEPATVYVRGRQLPDSKTPDWVGDILSQITVPIPFPGRGFDDFIKNFSLTDVNFKLPSPMADPDGPDGNPMVSGTIEVLAALPKEMNFDINVTKIRATADVFYQEKKLGELNLEHWQRANSTKLDATQKQPPMLKIQSRVVDAPLNITDSDVFTDVMQKLLFGGKDVMLDVKALVAVKVNTVLGKLILKDVPAAGKIPVKPLPGTTLGNLRPQIGGLKVLSTTSKSLNIEALVNITNPTPYTAYIPYINIHVVKNGSVIGSVTAENLNVTKGNNTNLLVTATWEPSIRGAISGQIGKDLLSQYISGRNVTIDAKAHRDSIPGSPLLGDALSKLNITVAAPRLDLPGGTPEDKGHFIRDATFHIFSSTATFTLVSPLEYNTIYIDWVNATAFYNHSEPVGQIEYDLPFAAPPGASLTPKLPVEWSIGSVGYEAVRNALGGSLKLDAKANATVRVGNWKETLWYDGKGIGANIRF